MMTHFTIKYCLKHVVIISISLQKVFFKYQKAVELMVAKQFLNCKFCFKIEFSLLAVNMEREGSPYSLSIMLLRLCVLHVAVVHLLPFPSPPFFFYKSLTLHIAQSGLDLTVQLKLVCNSQFFCLGLWRTRLQLQATMHSQFIAF